MAYVKHLLIHLFYFEVILLMIQQLEEPQMNYTSWMDLVLSHYFVGNAMSPELDSCIHVILIFSSSV